MGKYLTEQERNKLLNLIDEINLLCNIERTAITDNILYMFLYQSNFYSYVEIDEITIYSSFNVKNEDLIKKNLKKLCDKKIIFKRENIKDNRVVYILNNKMFKN